MQNLLKEPLNKNSQVIISHIESSRKIDNDGEASAVIGIPVDEIEKIESLLDEDDCKKFKSYIYLVV